MRAVGKLFVRKHFIRIITDAKPYQCSCCPISFSHRYMKQRHEKSCKEKVFYKCKICTKEYKMTDSLKSHEDACHNGILYKCGCGSTYRYRSGLRRHKMDKNHWTLAHHSKDISSYILVCYFITLFLSMVKPFFFRKTPWSFNAVDLIIKHNQTGTMLGRVRYMLFIQLAWSVSMTSHKEVSAWLLTLRQEIPNIHIFNWVY